MPPRATKEDANQDAEEEKVVKLGREKKQTKAKLQKNPT